MNEMESTTNFGCIILAAGRSERMKTPKAFLTFNKENTFLQHIVHTYEKAGITNRILVVNKNIEHLLDDNTRSKTTVVINPFPEKGRLFSVQLGMQVLGDARHCFIQNIDNPFISESLLRNMADYADKGDYLVPEYLGEGGHPVLIGNRLIHYTRTCRSYDKTLREIWSVFHKNRMPHPDAHITDNINTPEDYLRCFISLPVSIE